MMVRAKGRLVGTRRSICTASPRAEGGTALSGCDRSASDRMITKAYFGHRSRVKKITAVKNDRSRHFLLHHREIDISELGPFRSDDECFCTFGSLERAPTKSSLTDRFDLRRTFHPFRIVN